MEKNINVPPVEACVKRSTELTPTKDQIIKQLYTCGCGGCGKCEQERHPDALLFLTCFDAYR